MKKLYFLIWVVFGAKAQYPDPNIKSVRVVSDQNTTNGILMLGSNLYLSFDDLSNQYAQFHYKIVPYQADWSPSPLRSMEYINGFNDTIIENYQNSNQTKVPYLHYSVQITSPKMSGNYGLVVWRDSDPNTPSFEFKFSVYEPKVSIKAAATFATEPTQRLSHQQVQFDVNYGNYPLQNPGRDLKVVVRKNNSWLEAQNTIKPTAVQEASQTVHYQPIDGDGVFDGGNEFRFFDYRSSFRRGFYVAKVLKGKTDEVYIDTQRPRNQGAYIESLDHQGLWTPGTLDGTDAATQADYATVHLSLKTDEVDQGQVHVNGAFVNWATDHNTEMQYDPDLEAYTWSGVLKQGVYDYNFVLKTTEGISSLPFEGNYAETENFYEILVYHRPLSSRSDRLVGYQSFFINSRK